MNYLAYYIAQIIMSCLGMFFAYKILECEKVGSQWILYSFMVLQIVNLIGQIAGMYLYLFKRDDFDNAINKQTSTPSSSPSKTSEHAAAIATILTLLIAIAILCFIFNIYFLVKLFQCNTTWFGIYLVATILSFIPNFI